MERPIYECIAYDLGNELEDLKKYKKDLEKYTDFLEEEQTEQLIIADVSPRFSVSLVYLKTTINRQETYLQCLITDATSKEEALGKAIIHYQDEMKDYNLSNKVVLTLNVG